jgi:hypothetical protein
MPKFPGTGPFTTAGFRAGPMQQFKVYHNKAFQLSKMNKQAFAVCSFFQGKTRPLRGHPCRIVQHSERCLPWELELIRK